jgi:hypothetical protein
MLKTCLNLILEHNKLTEYHSKVHTLINQFGDEQLAYMLQRGAIIDQNSSIMLNFIPNVGFRCTNLNDSRIGKLPICGQLEHLLNTKYLEIIQSETKSNED